MFYFLLEFFIYRFIYRGVKDFTVSVSNDNVNFEVVVQDVLTNPINKQCSQIKKEYFQLSSPRMEKFIKFTAVTFHGDAFALQYFGWQ